MKRTWKIALATITIAATVNANAASEPLAGLGTQYQLISATSFVQIDLGNEQTCPLRFNSDMYFSDSCAAGSGSHLYIASVDLPEGATISSMWPIYYDNSTASQLYVYLYRTTAVDSTSSTQATSSQVPGMTFSTGVATADTMYHEGYAAPTSTTIFQHFSRENGVTYVHNYGLFLLLPTDTNVRFSGIEIGYQRQIAPAPAAATYTDVPTTHPFFNEIAQLGKSGITLGCGGGNYCPDSPVTRGQIAAFLSRALGLQWDRNT